MTERSGVRAPTKPKASEGVVSAFTNEQPQRSDGFGGRTRHCGAWELFVAKQRKRPKRSEWRGRSSEEEHTENAMASGAEEGRDKLRKAAGSCK